jgi:hypothetical protein
MYRFRLRSLITVYFIRDMKLYWQASEGLLREGLATFGVGPMGRVMTV